MDPANEAVRIFETAKAAGAAGLQPQITPQRLREDASNKEAALALRCARLREDLFFLSTHQRLTTLGDEHEQKHEQKHIMDCGARQREDLFFLSTHRRLTTLGDEHEQKHEQKHIMDCGGANANAPTPTRKADDGDDANLPAERQRCLPANAPTPTLPAHTEVIEKRPRRGRCRDRTYCPKCERRTYGEDHVMQGFIAESLALKKKSAARTSALRAEEVKERQRMHKKWEEQRQRKDKKLSAMRAVAREQAALPANPSPVRHAYKVYEAAAAASALAVTGKRKRQLSKAL